MFSSTLLSAVLAAAAQDASEPQRTEPVQHLATVEVGPRELRRFSSLGLDVSYTDIVAGRAEVILKPGDAAVLDANGFPWRITIEDLQGYYEDRLALGSGPLAANYGTWLNPPFGQGDMGGYYTLAEIESVLDQMQAAYPNLITGRTSLGTTIQGRSIWWVRISDNAGVDENEPEVRIDSLHHAREPQGMQTTLWFMLYLLEEYGSDPLATYLVDEREIYFVPCVNPDGYEYNRQIAPNGGGLWRKNRRNNGGGSFGVDLNRNYPFQWGFDNFGSSPDPDSEVYRGAGAASEPEVLAMTAFISGRSFTTALSVHTYSNLWLGPWGYDELFPANQAQYDEVGDLAVEFSGYVHGPASIVLYEANGITVDYDHGQHGTLSWTPEIGSSDDGFWPPQSRIVPLAEENLEAFQRTALAGGAWIRPSQVALVDAGDGDGAFEPGEAVDFTATLRNSGTVASGAVALTLTSTSPWVTITNGSESAGSIASFSDGSNGAPLTLSIAGGAPSGTVVPYVVTVEYEGWSRDLPGSFLVGEVVVLASYDFDAGGNQGWGVGAPNDASTGNWVRVNPIGTAAQPEDDHTPTGTRCWVTGQGSQGGSVGENDVDGGSTTLLSPVFDLDGTVQPQISYWRWYSNDEGSAPQSDVFQIDLSNDGGSSWVAAETVGPTGTEASGGWFESVLDVGSIVTPTSQVRIRFIASDLGSGSIVEAAIDDVEVSYIADPGCPIPQNYCDTSPNSVGPGALMSWGGSTDVADDDFTLVATGTVPSKPGLFFYGTGQTQVPVGNGFRCVDGSLFRLQAIFADGGGTATFPLDFSDLPNGGDIMNGETWYFQWWYRDSMVGAGYNFSDGICVEFCAD